MLLNRIIKGLEFKQLNVTRYLFYAIGEVILIFAGITLSLWFTNWNEKKHEREIEVKLIKELRQSFISDLDDLKGNEEIRNRSKYACNVLLEAINQDLPYHDSLDIYFGNAFLAAGLTAKGSAYDNLKSRGVYTITNDSLRFQIINIHDLSYPAIWDAEQRHGDLFFNILIPFNSTRFNSGNPYMPLKPVNYKMLMKDGQFKYYLNVIIFYNDFQMNIGRKIQGELDEVIHSIDKELKLTEGK